MSGNAAYDGHEHEASLILDFGVHEGTDIMDVPFEYVLYLGGKKIVGCKPVDTLASAATAPMAAAADALSSRDGPATISAVAAPGTHTLVTHSVLFCVVSQHTWCCIWQLVP